VGRAYVERNRPNPMGEEPWEVLGDGLEPQCDTSQTWETKTEEETAYSYEEAEKLTALSLMYEYYDEEFMYE